MEGCDPNRSLEGGPPRNSTLLERVPPDRWQQLELQMLFLREQSLEEWVIELETLVMTEVWLACIPSLPVHPTLSHLYPCIEGEDYNGPGLFWDAFDIGMALRNP
ncbi:Hypothetical predicted protein, partial [Pelobates cultripes]